MPVASSKPHARYDEDVENKRRSETMHKGRNDNQDEPDFNELRNHLRRLKERHKQLLDELSVIEEKWTQTMASGPKIAGVPLGDFKHGPYLEVGRGILHDGPGGTILPRNVLSGAMKSILAHLLINREIHLMEVLATQVKRGSGTIAERKRHAESTIAKLKRATNGMGLSIAKKGGRHSVEWVLERDARSPVVFSVELASDLAISAQHQLGKDKPCCAIATALKALRCDDHVHSAHLILCTAAAKVGPGGFNDRVRLRKSVDVIRERAEQIDKCLEIIDRASAANGDEVTEDLKYVGKRFRVERDQHCAIITQVGERFPDLFERERPEDSRANEAIVALRDKNLGLDDARRNPLAMTVLEPRCVERVRARAQSELPATSTCKERTERSSLVNTLILAKAIDPNVPANIRWVCKAIDHDMWKVFNPPSGDDTNEARLARELDAAKMRLFQRLERDPTSEEVSAELGWSVSKILEIEDWSKKNKPGPIDQVDQEQRKRRKKRSDDPEDDPGYDPCADGVSNDEE